MQSSSSLVIALLGACSDSQCATGSAPVAVVASEVRDRYVRLDLEYSGGCSDHEFAVWWSGVATPSIPTHVQFDLQHYDHDDSCEALVTEAVWVDLSPLHEFPGGDRALINVIPTAGGRGVTVDYAFGEPTAPPSDDVLTIASCNASGR